MNNSDSIELDEILKFKRHCESCGECRLHFMELLNGVHMTHITELMERNNICISQIYEYATKYKIGFMYPSFGQRKRPKSSNDLARDVYRHEFGFNYENKVVDLEHRLFKENSFF